MKELEILNNDIKNIAEAYTGAPWQGWITGDGPVPAEILFVGEAPGKSEVQEGKPFVGIAGKAFESYLNKIGLQRKDVRITNTCYLRPIKIKTNAKGRKTISNRPPKQSEIELFKDILDREINLVGPRIIVTLGNTPLKRLTSCKSIGECHGKLICNEKLHINIFPMYHPSALTYNRNDSFSKIYEADWNKLKEILFDA